MKMEELTEVQRFCMNVQAICKDRKIPISSVEEKIGVSAGYLSRIRKGNKKLTIDKAISIAHELGCDLMQLLTLDWWKQYRIKELEAELSLLERR